MDLQFLGIGSAFETKLYNTSAFFVDGEKLFLIDCGETTIAQLEALHLLNYVKEVYVAITHTHSDHVAGIGHLVRKCNIMLGNKLNIVVPAIDKFNLHEKLKELLNIFFIPANHYNIIDENDMYNKFNSFSSISFIPTNHCQELIGNCFSILLDTPNGIVFYSGDSTNIANIKKLLDYNIDKMYIDVTLSIKNVHLDLNLLESIVPIEKRKKIFCMHFDSTYCMEQAKEIGFNIANSIACNISKLPLSFEYNFEKENTLVLSNCGELAFMQIMQNEVYSYLTIANKIYLNLKNTEYKNIASLGSFLSYLYFVLKKSLYIRANTYYTKYNVMQLLKIYGLPIDSVVFLDN